MKKKEEPQMILSENVKPSYGFNFKLSYSEAYEAFLVLAEKWNKKIRWIVSILLTLITVTMLVLNFLDNRKVHYFFIAIIALLLLSYLIYAPVLKAKRGATKVQKQNGTYKFKITAEGKIILPSKEIIDIKGDKDARAVETKTIFALRPDSTNTLCIPKRSLQEKDTEGIRELLKAYLKYEVR